MYVVSVTFLVASASAHKNEMDIAVYTGGHKWPVHLVFGPDAPVPTQLYRSARLRWMRSSKKVSVHLRVSLALLARKTPPLAMGHAEAKPCRGREGKKGEVEINTETVSLKISRGERCQPCGCSEICAETVALFTT